VPVLHGDVNKPRTGQMPNGDLPQPGNYSTPPFGQAGRPVSVAGPFDGDFNNTAVKLANQPAQFLAESPRKVVVRNPANVIGRATIEVKEQNKVVASCSYQSVSIKLAAEKLNLIRGEQTTLTATLSGLDGVTGPVSMQLTNATPWTVRMEGGESQTITAQPQEFANGSFFATRTLTGVRAGGFSINAIVKPGGIWRGLLRACNGGTPASEPVSGLNRGDRTVSNPGLASPGKNATAEAQQYVFSERDALKNLPVDDSSGAATGVLPDLTIKGMCLDDGPSVPSETLRVLIANIGDRDADPFNLGINFMYSTDYVIAWHVDKITGLKVGEERWLEYHPMSGSGFTLAHIVEHTDKFQVIADPTYWQSHGYFAPTLEKSKIIESNEANNTVTISRAEMRRCDAKNSLPRPATPKIEVTKPVRP